MQAIILAGGQGTQLHPLNMNISKLMAPLFDRPVMEHCISLLAKHGITDIIVTVSHLAKDIMCHFGDGSRMGVSIRYFIENEPLGTAGGVKQVQSLIKGTFVVISGDAVTDADLSAAITAHKSSSAIATLLLYEADDPTQFGLVRCEADGRITRFLEKPKSSEVFTHTINTGIYILEPEVLSCIPYNQVYDFARNLFPRMLNNQEPVYGLPLPGYWCDIGNLNQYRNAHIDALKGAIKLELPATCVGDGVWMGDGVDIHPSVRLSSPMFLGHGVTLKRDVVLGERVVIGEDTVIDEGAHVLRSVLGCGSFVGKDSRISDCIIAGSYAIGANENLGECTLVANLHYNLPSIKPAPASPMPRTTSQVQTRQERKVTA